MERPFQTKDAKRMREEHGEILSALHAVTEAPERCAREIRQSVDALVEQEAMRLLRDVPVEELNRDKRGIRVKALRDHGYQSMADLASAPPRALYAVAGIGEDTAYAIRRIVDEMVSKTRQGVRIRLSIDDRSAAAGRLVSALSRYRGIRPEAEAGSALLGIYGSQIRRAMDDLSAGTNGLSWLFASGARKQRAAEAYRLLEGLSGGAYGQSAHALLARFRTVGQTSDNAAWQDFAAHAAGFFQTLEELCPGVLGNADSVYGLPEELAQEVRNEPFSRDGLLCDLRRYQQWGVKYILHQKRVLLGDEMGLGKTVQAIAAMVSLQNAGATHFAVVCPASVLTNWCREIEKMSRMNVTKVHGAARSAALRYWLENGGVAVTTYETTGRIALPGDFGFSMLVVDEAHYIKNPETQRTSQVRRLCGHAQRLLFMTGTALENRVEEMISLIGILRPDIARSVQRMAFLSTAPQFREAVAPVYFRRKREDVLTELPELTESREWCTMGLQETIAYEMAVLGKNYAEARRVSWNVGDLRNSSKARRMLEIIDEAASEGRKVIVFSFFLDTLRKVGALLGERCLQPINGSVPPQRRQEILDEFDSAPAGTVLAAQIQSGGTGLNIQSASVVILCEPQFKPSSENQAISRAYRMGQTRNVLVYRLLCEDTVDEKITSILESKQAVFDAFADKSAAAEESLAIDERSFGTIMKEESERIAAKRRQTDDQTDQKTGREKP